MNKQLIEILTLSKPKMIYDIPHYYVEFKYLNNGETYKAELIDHKGKLLQGMIKSPNGKGCKIRTKTLSKIVDELKEYTMEAINYTMN